MRIGEVKKACNDLLASAFPDITVYNGDTLDGYKRPAFFTEILSRNRSPSGQYITETGYTFKITYFERTHSEAECLSIYEKICDLFGAAIKVGINWLTVEDIDYQWIDEHMDKLQVTIRFHRSVRVRRKEETGDLMRTVDLTVNE